MKRYKELNFQHREEEDIFYCFFKRTQNWITIQKIISYPDNDIKYYFETATQSPDSNKFYYNLYDVIKLTVYNYFKCITERKSFDRGFDFGSIEIDKINLGKHLKDIENKIRKIK